MRLMFVFYDGIKSQLESYSHSLSCIGSSQLEQRLQLDCDIHKIKYRGGGPKFLNFTIRDSCYFVILLFCEFPDISRVLEKNSKVFMLFCHTFFFASRSTYFLFFMNLMNSDQYIGQKSKKLSQNLVLVCTINSS